MWALIRQSGLEHLAKIRKIQIDHSLITGLVERWRPETNTFHLNSGEATVTLEDVAYIYGLPIDGLPVNGRTFSAPSTMVKLCGELLGVVPDVNYDCYGVQIKFTWLKDNFELEPKSRPRDQDVRQTRAFLFCLVAGQIFWTSSGTKAPAHILKLFRRFDRRSWGSACLANLYRGLAKVSLLQKKGKVVKTITGPLKLLQVINLYCIYLRITMIYVVIYSIIGTIRLSATCQVWAYSRMTIGKPIRRRGDWDTDVEFPLVLTWYNRLRSHHFQTRVEEAKRHLDIMEVDAFNWIPYRNYENIHDYIDNADVPLFRSNTALISFWIVERHCPQRVMKQFCLHQVVPPIFQRPFPRNEMIPIGDNKREKIRSIYTGVWNTRMDAITYGEEGDAGPHTDAYFQWYRGITRLRIGRPTSGSGHNLSSVQSQSAKGDSANSPAVVCPKKRKSSNTATQSSNTPTGTISPVVAKPPKRSKRLKDKLAQSLDSSKPTSPKDEVICEAASIPISLSPRRSSRLAHRHQSPKSPIKVVRTIGSTAKSPSMSPFTSIPWSGPEMDSTPTPVHPKFGIGASPFKEISSMILNVKARYRDPKPPLWMADYNTRAWMRNPKYKLTLEELDVLTVFRNEYADTNGRTNTWTFSCVYWSKPSLFHLPQTMHSWFQVLKEQAASSYFFECALSDLYVHADSSEKHVQNSFGLALLDNLTEKEFIFFPVWNKNHFFLLVGRVSVRRWEYYNSLDRNGDYLLVERYIDWLNDRFMQFGWSDPMVWTKCRMECPMQTNSVDCGIFVMAYARHIALGLPMDFTKNDMYYYRAKIVYDLYIDQYTRWRQKVQDMSLPVRTLV
ncbi:serine/threonine-protein phosphatase 7 long form [Cinnamomum micranthum f. kanehirae]|uniref:Serine/threonine-protein phosphatase 7 long form n=1 Tax=Cinnamomum micranthum f. kanehirae TaxID=337451 RepID=A0A3S3Q0B0_9MAGN|nr:serine/threonine-protein phosphatase 7 long form [Cinnamomum micranthum f. kanehirae]